MNRGEIAAHGSTLCGKQLCGGDGVGRETALARGGASAGDDKRGTIRADITTDGIENEDLGSRDLRPNQHQQKKEQQQQHGPSGGSILSQCHLRVLLVEDDDSTRHVVAALLRNCGYEVTPAANGLQAWELLENPKIHVDLVLSDVMMPGLSGIDLLGKIMSHEARKQLPVVMMSCLDSMDIVFKCLSKGAVDFLVKPVRKNELKNLWQHFWRKCLSSSGSGSGSQTGKVIGASGDSYGGSENVSSGLNVEGGSDNGSGTQSSWTKKPVEVYSHRELLTQPVLQPDKRGEAIGHNERLKEHVDANGNAKPSCKARDLLGSIQNQDMDSGTENGKPNAAVPDSVVLNHSSSLPTLELSLKRSRVKDGEEGEAEQKCLLRHSGGSAFSRYSNNAAQQHPTSSSFPLGLWPGGFCMADGSVPAGESPYAGNGAVIGSPEGVRAPTNEGAKPMQHFSLAPNILSYDGIAAYGQALHHLFYSAPPPWGNGPTDRAEECAHPHVHHHHHHLVEHHHHHGAPKDEQTVDNQRAGAQQCVSSNVTGEAPDPNGGQSGSSNEYGVNVNGSVSGSNNLSNNMQNGHSNGHSEAGVTAGGNDSASGSGNNNGNSRPGNGIPLAGNEANGAGSVACPENNNILTRREAALNKFRQKRKERCFEKKVRYQSRKRLAEQRPRIRGQFVKQATFCTPADLGNSQCEEDLEDAELDPADAQEHATDCPS